MSMIAVYVRLTADELGALLRDPSSVHDLLERVGEGDDSANPTIDLDKSWHAIHFMLTGDAWGGAPPLVNAVMGGTELGEEEVGGPVRYLTHEEVRAVADALTDIKPEDLGGRYDPARLEKADIYPNIWERDGADALEYVLGYYELLRDFFIEASSLGDCMLLYVG